MSDEHLVLSLLEEVVECGRTPEVVCVDHPDLLTEVRRRLGLFDQVRDELDALFPDPHRTRADPSRPSRTGGLPDVPGHDVEAVLGRGGMGVVYRARHRRLNRPVALKMMIAGTYAGPQELARFRRESESLAELGHPHVVQVHEAGDLDGLPYFTMELVEGGTLAEKLAGVPQPPDRAADLMMTLAGAVQAAHDRGIVHRDLKPANILLTPDGTPKISDFGLARRLDPGACITRTGVRVGTPSYMAPEQAAGTPGSVGPAVDVYALGAVLYELLTGRPPFLAESAAETERQVIAEEPAPPSRLNARVPRDLETICLKCLHKDPRRRYASAASLGDDLGRFRRGETIAARPAGTLERVGKWVRRHPGRAAGVAGIALVAAALFGSGWWLLAHRAATARAVTDDLDETDRALERSAWLEARTSWERAKLKLGDRSMAELRNRLDRAGRDLELAARLDAIPMNRAESGGRLTGTRGFDTGASDRDYQAAFKAAGLGTVDESPERVAERVRSTVIRRAIVAALDDWAACAESDRRRWVVEVARQSDTGPGSEWRAKVRDPAVWGDMTALEALIRTAQDESESVPLQLTLARHFATRRGNAVGFLRRIQAAHPNDFWAAFWLAEVLADRDDAEAVACYQAALAARPQAVVARLRIANFLSRQGRLGEATEHYRQALQLDPANDHAHYSQANNDLYCGQLDAAAGHCREVIRLNPGFGHAHALMGQILLEQGRFDESRSECGRALDLLPVGEGTRQQAVRTIQRCDRMLALDGRLSGIAGGADQPSDANEGIDFAELCARKCWYAAAARLYTDAFAAPSKVGRNPGNHAHEAARAAARAGCGEGEDAAELDDPARVALRGRALAWLRAERDAMAEELIRSNAEGQKGVVWTLRLWQQDAALAGVRDAEGLAALREDERQRWRSLWDGVENLVAGDRVPSLASAREYAAQGDWKLAAVSYERIFNATSIHDGQVWFEFAAVHLLAGDLQNYRLACTTMMYNAPKIQGIRPYHVARAWTLSPGPVDDAARLSAGELRSSGAEFWSLTEQAALLHRAGRFLDAVPLLHQSLAADRRSGTQVLNCLWLSLCFFRIGEFDEGQRWLDRATDWLDQFGGRMPFDADAVGLHLHNWLEARLLRQEAESLLRSSRGTR
jgi:serine/threonine-protein kinase